MMSRCGGCRTVERAIGARLGHTVAVTMTDLRIVNARTDNNGIAKIINKYDIRNLPLWDHAPAAVPSASRAFVAERSHSICKKLARQSAYFVCRYSRVGHFRLRRAVGSSSRQLGIAGSI